ncbi:amino acid transporter [Aulographum hederae CBS 113979]|uniref:Amino acid transporter n=1 Tax=Aulographum hederae CBS 113979 TaxID=1176131 RepID=A0A6G1HFI4_9PEZI|nr:amino acid transporter [Aulographum hederae CBS 113979]
MPSNRSSFSKDDSQAEPFLIRSPSSFDGQSHTSEETLIPDRNSVDFFDKLDVHASRSPFPSALRSPFELTFPSPRLSGEESGLLYRNEPHTFPEASPLGRNIKWSSAYILIISRVIGSGIFATPGVILASVGSIGVALLLWLLGAVVSACGLAVSLELGCAVPRSGGDAKYLQFIYDRPRFLASTVVAVQAILLGFSASNCIVFGKYVMFALGNDIPSEFSQRVSAVLLLTCVTLVHGCYLKAGIRIQNVLGWIKIGVLLFMAVSGIAVLFISPIAVDSAQIKPGKLSWDAIWEGSEWNFSNLATAFFKISYCYSGYDTVNNVMDEVKDPIRTLKSAAPAAMLTIFIFYFLLNIAYFVVVPAADIKSSGELVAALFFERIFGTGVGGRVLPILIALSAAGNVMVSTFTQARVNQQIARQGFLPYSRFLASSKPFNAPLGGLLVHYIPSVLVITLPPQGQVYSFILEVKGYPAQLTSLFICIGLLWLRLKQPALKRPFKAPRFAVWLIIALSIALLAAPFFPPADGVGEFSFWYGTYAVVGTGILAFAVLYWWMWVVVVPGVRGKRYEEVVDELDDGTIITRLVQVPKPVKGP